MASVAHGMMNVANSDMSDAGNGHSVGLEELPAVEGEACNGEPAIDVRGVLNAQCHKSRH